MNKKFANFVLSKNARVSPFVVELQTYYADYYVFFMEIKPIFVYKLIVNIKQGRIIIEINGKYSKRSNTIVLKSC